MGTVGNFRLKRLPDVLLALLVIAHMWPLATGRWLITLDGPCHLYHARLMNELVAGGPASGFFQLNLYPEPNLLGYWMLSAMQLVLPAWLSMHLLYAVITVGTALAFRSLARALAPDDPWKPLLGLPFLLTYPLVMGFFNFSLGIAVLLLTMAVWERRMRLGGGRIWPTMVIVGLLYLAHLTAFLVGATWLIARAVWAWWHGEDGMRTRSQSTMTALIASLGIPLVLVIGYFMRMEPREGVAFRFDASELLQWVPDGRAWITFSYDDDLPWTRVAALSMLALACVGAGLSAVKRDYRVVPWFMAAIGLFALYLILPDVLAGGSLNSPRMLLFTMMFLCAGAMAARLPTWTSAMAGAVISVASIGHMSSFMRAERGLQAAADDLLTIAPHLDQRSVVLPLNYSDNWLHSNLSNLLGARSGAVILDHFVAQAPFAPVQWRPERLPYAAIGDFDRSSNPCVSVNGYRDEHLPLVTHVLTYRMPKESADSCAQDVMRQLETEFSPIAESAGGALLYVRSGASVAPLAR